MMESAALRAQPASPSGDAQSMDTCCPSCAYTPASFAEVWDLIQSDPYAELPHERVTLGRFFRGFRNRMLQDARRTLADGSDILPRFEKLIRPNGICLSGTWNVEQASPFTGLFAAGTRVPIVARASVGLSDTESGSYRSFGMAAKLFPSSVSHARVPTANFFVIDDNAGTRTANFLDAEMTNDPVLSMRLNTLLILPLLVAIAAAQRRADSHSGSRQLYPLASAGVRDGRVRAPRFIRLRGAPGPVVDASDFREQLRVAKHKGALRFEIHVRDLAQHPWQRLGQIVFDADAASDSCDHRLHFTHPRWRPERD